MNHPLGILGGCPYLREKGARQSCVFEFVMDAMAGRPADGHDLLILRSRLGSISAIVLGDESMPG